MQKHKIPAIWLLLAAGFFVRLLAFQIDFAFDNDVHTFQAWAIYLHNNGFRAFYESDFLQLTDYPPVYMYVLFGLGVLRSIFDWQVLSPIFNFFTFLPSMLADIGIGYVLYRLVCRGNKDGEPDKFALLVTAAWIFNPAVILISSVWGQVESIFSLMLLISLLFVREKKFLPAYMIFGAAILTKPQSLFLGPVFLYSAIYYLWENKFDKKAVMSFAGALGAGLAVMVAVSLPFGLVNTFNQLLSGMDLYNFASVNAFNIWALFGMNWRALDTTLLGLSLTVWGVIIVLIIIGVSLYVCHTDQRRHGGKHFFLIVAALFITIFMFSVKMHERYLFPGFLFLLVYFIENRDKRIAAFYIAFSATFFANCFEILRWLRGGFDLRIIESSLPVISFFNVTIAIVFLIMLGLLLAERIKPMAAYPIRFNDTQKLSAKSSSNKKHAGKKSRKSAVIPEEPPPPKKPPKMNSRDWIFLAILILVYSALAFYNLGDTEAPQTNWTPEAGETVRIDLGDIEYISTFQFFNGSRHDRPFSLYASNDEEYWSPVWEMTEANVFYWTFVELSGDARFLEIVSAREGLRLQEVAFRGADGEILPIISVSAGGEALFDEQHLVPERRTFMNSTFFDEIYHPRAGYEYVHGLPVFENTHPPLGKVFIAISVRFLGMTPFAWRLPGTLFGIFMIPLMFAFARQMFNSNKLGIFAAFILTFDFMLFSQTRLATIDTYVTFFVLAMFFAMYMYVKGIGVNSLTRSLSLLAICGALMGLAVASKWQGIYGALGLPILFFPALYKLYLRDKHQAKITFFACFGFFVAIPLVIYSLSYIPFVYASGGGGLRTIWDNQVTMWTYHSELVAEHPFASAWWSWPLIMRPLWQYLTVIDETTRQSMSSIGSPAVWWFGIFATVYAGYRLWKNRFKESDVIFLFVAYAAQFLPWALVSRLTFIYHYFPSVPFVILLIVWFFKDRVKRPAWYFAYGGLVLALFALFYPILSGMPMNVHFVRTYLQWFPTWIFM